MASEFGSPEVGPTTPEPAERRARRSTWIGVGSALGLVLLLVIPLVFHLGWAPILHAGCQPGGVIGQSELYSPGVIGNSPYGGYVWANGSFPWNPPPVAGAGGTEYDGGSFGDLSVANFTVANAQNVTVFGPGANEPCTSPYVVSVGAFEPVRIELVGLLPEGTPNDTNASLSVPPIGLADPGSVMVGDRFLAENTPAIDTCNSSVPAQATVSGSSLTVAVSVATLGGSILVPVTIAVTTFYHYWFPPHFGVWLVDDLSANGYLPGAGWAFSFRACG